MERQDRERKKIKLKMKIFDLYETDAIAVNDPGLKRVINLNSKLVLKTHGRIKGNFSATKINIVPLTFHGVLSIIHGNKDLS